MADLDELRARWARARQEPVEPARPVTAAVTPSLLTGFAAFAEAVNGTVMVLARTLEPMLRNWPVKWIPEYRTPPRGATFHVFPGYFDSADPADIIAHPRGRMLVRLHANLARNNRAAYSKDEWAPTSKRSATASAKRRPPGKWKPRQTRGP